MDLSWGDAHAAFREEVRDFLVGHWSRADLSDAEKVREFRVAAVERGYLYRNVPRRFGGSEQIPDVLKAQIIREEFARVRAPTEIAGVGTEMLVPTLLEWGEPWQQEHFIPKTIAGDYVWAQGYSEPGAGSDLASLRTRAQLVGDEWVINGQKIWTTRAHLARFMFALVRTEPGVEPKHAGISYLLLDLHQPGIEIRPLKQITGASGFCEVFFTDARTPADWIVGKRGEGWKVSKSTLKHERSMISNAVGYADKFGKLLRLAQLVQRNGRPAIQDAEIRQRLARLEGYVRAHQYSSYRQLTRSAMGAEPGLIGLMNKLVSTNLGHEMAKIALDLLGDDGLRMPAAKGGKVRGNEKWIELYFGSLGVSIAGGASNIQRNIIAERGLGLPRED